jgi:hypothetical protein
MNFLLALLIGATIFFGGPLLIVRFRSNDQKNPKPRKEKPYWVTKVEPGHGKLTMKAGVPNRLHAGPGYRFAGNNLGDRASWVASPRKPGEKTNGGKLSFWLYILEAWLFFVTGYKFIGRTLIDTLSPTTELYLREITREKDEWKATPDRPKDITDHFILAQQERPFSFSEAETARAGKVFVGGQEVPADEGVPMEGRGSYLLQIKDVWKVLFEISGDELSLSKKKAEEGAREIIQGGIADQFLGTDGKSKLAEGLATIDDNKDKDGKVSTDGENKGTRELFGFDYVQFILTDLDLGGKFKDLFRKKAEERVSGLAALEAAERKLKVAEVEREIARTKAQGDVAFEAQELTVLNESMRQMRASGGLGSEDTARLLSAREKRKAIQGFEGTTLVLSEGGQPPLTAIPITGTSPKKDIGE